MNQYIEELKNDHKIIIEFFDNIDKSEKFDAQKELVRKLTDVLTIHLKKEDEYLYPALAKSKNEEIARLGDIFSSAMKNIAKDYIVFVEQFLKNSEPSAELADAYKKMSKKVRNRVTIEEVVLYPAYEKSL
ncbi:MAG: hemerythrin domain-containing protein [bacterium]|nr:hemerythrin domain-containing protein [bacterium]